MIGLILLFFILFIIWTFLMKNNKLIKIDNNIYSKMVIKEPRITFLKIFTNLASTIFFIIVCVLLLIVLKNKSLAILISLLMIIDSLLIFTFKHLFKRERPNIKRLVREKGYSFPSGHSVSAIFFYGLVAFFIILSSLAIPLKIGLCAIICLIIFIIGYSRIYLGVHYFSDVIGGFFLGSSYVLLVVYLLINYWCF